MNSEIIDLHDWLQTPGGSYLSQWESTELGRSVVDLFGFHALQLGLVELDGLASNRMPHRWLAAESSGPGVALVTDFAALPFPSASLDLVLLPHTLDLSPDPHATLREVERVLVPEGKVVICGFNPLSLWGLQSRIARAWRRGEGQASCPAPRARIAYLRLRDWLRLLGFEVEIVRFGCYRPLFRSEVWMRRMGWMDRWGERYWPVLGAVYFVVATRRVRGMTLISPTWRSSPGVSNAPVSIANNSSVTRLEDPNRSL